MSNVIDRRAQGKNKSAVNRARFLERYKGKIERAVRDSISDRSVTDSMDDTTIIIDTDDGNYGITEPVFRHGQGGNVDHVGTGNEEYEVGDEMYRPRGGRGRGPGNEGDPFSDDFIFTLTKEEFMKFFFDGLSLPDMTRKSLKDTLAVKHQRAGYKTSGATTNMHVLRSMRGALGRRMALGGRKVKELHELEEEVIELRSKGVPDDDAHMMLILERISTLEAKLARIPFLDEMDIRYSNTIAVPKPSARAVMFCVMDVSGSMDETKKEIAKKFYILLHLFLSREYSKVEVVFISHHTEAKEVSEHNFFYSQESGGTIVSSAINLLNEIIKDRYSDSWNVYIAQASDGDNSILDSKECREIIEKEIMPAVQYYAYVEITDGYTQSLWRQYELIAKEYSNFAMRQLKDYTEIYPVFRDLFKNKDD